MGAERMVRAGPAGARNWPLLIAALALAGAVSLSIHVVMIEALGVAYPEDGGTPTWAKFANMAGTVIAMLAFYRLARPPLERRGPLARWLIVFAVLAMVKETLRGLVMDGVVTGAWAFAVLKEVPSTLLMLLIAAAVVAVGSRLSSWVALLSVGVVIAAAAFFAAQPAIGAAYGPWLQSMASLAHDDLYQLPYPIQVMVPAYLTFAEPVLGCAVVAALIWPRLSQRPWLRIGQFALLITLIKGVVVRTLVYSAFMKAPLGAAMLSQGQFGLEFLALALLTGLIWQSWGRRAA